MLLREKIVSLENGFLAELLAGVILLCPILGVQDEIARMGKILAAKYLKLENSEYLSATKIVRNSIKSFLKTKVPVNTDTCQEGELMQQQQSY